MCGISGIIKENSSVDVNQLLSMTKVLKHRGPDDEGYLLVNTEKKITTPFHHDDTIESIKAKIPKLENNINANIGFGFRRLSILDLSEHGHQPMQFKDAGLWIVYNGEIYNFIELRDELKHSGYKFESNTDTEVILKAYHKWGENCIHKFNGMWAFALWDSENQKLFCSRDRFGVKPFYYHFDANNQFLFASEIKSILQVIKPRPDRESLNIAFTSGYSDHNNKTFFEDIKQLKGGHNLTLQNGRLDIYRYYFLKSQPINTTFETAKEKLKELLFDSVRIRLRSDVPVGYALSGGIDSSCIVGVASKINTGFNNTFSMIYPGDSVDESFFIKKVIEKTGVRHHFVSPGFNDFINDLNKFIWHQEEPFFGTSYFGEFKLRELIRKKGVIVSLEGQGADEIITGYSSLVYPYFYDLISGFKIPKFINEFNRFKHFENNLVNVLKAYFGRNKKKSNGVLNTKYPFLNKNFFPEYIEFCNQRNTYQKVLPDKPVSDICMYPYCDLCSYFNEFDSGSHLNNTLYEMLFYTSIPQQLVRADKSSMAFSVECRFPFLDYRVVEYALNLPFEFKIHNGITKYVLRESMKELLPQEVYNRKDKIGFAIPDEKFGESDYKKRFIQIVMDSASDEFDFINKEKFYSTYQQNGVKPDWKFWKTVSVQLWYNNLINKV